MKVRQVTIFETVQVTRVTTAEVPEDWDTDKIKDAYLCGDNMIQCNVLESEPDWQSEESVSIDKVEFNSEVYDNEV